MYTPVIILLVFLVVVDSCDLETNYQKDGQCCKMCGPGKRMKLNTDCKDPSCEECGDMEYQDGYTKENICKRQPFCDTNLNFKKQNSSSKTEISPCQCIPGHHCSSSYCDTCVKNTECKLGERVSENGTQTSDTECEPCPKDTFSSTTGAFTCQPWTECISVFESVSGSSTSDRTCRVRTDIIIGVFVGLLFLLALGVLFFWYKKVKMGSAALSKKAHECCEIFGVGFNPKPLHDEAETLNEQLHQVNQPQEDTEDLLRPDTPLTPGVSENGNPVSQDHSKSSILSQLETEPSSQV
ncbi:tumor necrosis factor receptor superfamily member 5 [Trichomycterus rosablanca]|uniref:tumor necrosis factor receptor superfamily member 5 n=1 Tax=Trichomycterus rosablanca TaxID=2290929 RepID=UPI002F350B35